MPYPPENPFNNSTRHDVYLYTNKAGATDTEYVQFGWWNSYSDHDGTIESSLPDGELSRVSMTPYATGNSEAYPELHDGDNHVAKGTASYSGHAVGLYARKIQNVYREGGQFAATVTFSADFSATRDTSQGDPEPKEQFLTVISGQITNFKNDQGNVIDSSWTVPLSRFAHDYADQGEALFRGPSGWNYLFHGAIAGDSTNMAPNSIIGTFEHSFTNGEVAGAYAASKQ
ncbi:MAG: hypothetical protein F4X93_02320 [Proteobacteria bacterium]|nr:hypothetical protein [Pseudomonadota bacterium]